MASSSHRPKFVVAVALAAAVGGSLMAVRIHRLGLTLTHYDARGHLVVARRIFDSITPGWQQIGAVWLPLPHLLNAIPVQVDAFYRTGASAVAFSVVAFAIACGAISWMVFSVTGSVLAAVSGAAVFGLNPNVLYLQATPMTEPMLIGLTLLALALLMEWSATGETSPGARRVGWAFALACLTRYEAWPVTASALALAVWARWRTGSRFFDAARSVAGIAAYPAVAIAGFIVFSRVVVGEWFVSSGFFVAENPALGHPMTALDQVGWGLRVLTGPALLAAAVAGLAVLATSSLVRRSEAASALPLVLVTTSLLPLLAFVKGHPYRIRYLVPLIAAEALFAGIAAGWLRRFSRLTAFALLLAALVELKPMSLAAPMIVEAQWDSPNVARRKPVTDYLRSNYDGETVMASMGSLGHYMQDLSQYGFHLRDFLHEGNGDIWLTALDDPHPYVGWILIEEQAEGGDMLAGIARRNPRFLQGFSRVSEGAGLALYRRVRRASTTLLP